MVVLVVPHRIAAEAGGRFDDRPGIVVGGLQERVHPASPTFTQAPGQRRHLLEEGTRSRIHDRVHGIEPQPVEAEVADPPTDVVEEQPTDLVAARAGQVHGPAPGCGVGVGHVRAVGAGHVALGSEVVVDDVEHHCETQPVGGLHEARERLGASVAVLHRVGEHAVVSPAPLARELGQRHQLHGGDTEIGQPLELGGRGIQGPLRGEGPDVQLVEHRRVEVGSLEAGASSVCSGRRFPRGETIRIDHRRGAEHAFGLVPRGGIRQFPHDARSVGDPEPVARAVARAGDGGGPGGPELARIRTCEGMHLTCNVRVEHHVDHPCGWCPDLEAHASVGHGRSRPVGTVGVVVALGSEAGGHHTGWIDRSGHGASAASTATARGGTETEIDWKCPWLSTGVVSTVPASQVDTPLPP